MRPMPSSVPLWKSPNFDKPSSHSFSMVELLVPGGSGTGQNPLFVVEFLS